MTPTDELTTDAGADKPAPDRPAEDHSGSSPARPGTRNKSTRIVIAVLAVLLAGTTALAAVFGLKWQERRATDDAATAALAAAQQYAVALTSIDSTHLDADFAAIADGATGKFKDMYTRSAGQLEPLLAEAQSVSKGRVVAASIQSASPDRAVVLLFVDAEITNTATPQPRLERNRIIMTMDRVGDRWLAAEVELV